jgi:hypothetical protein
LILLRFHASQLTYLVVHGMQLPEETRSWLTDVTAALREGDAGAAASSSDDKKQKKEKKEKKHKRERDEEAASAADTAPSKRSRVESR